MLLPGVQAKSAGNLARTLLSLFNHTKTLSLTQQLHAQIVIHGFHEALLFCSNVTNAYISSGSLDLASKSFEQIPAETKNLYSWNTILSGYSKNKRFRDVLLLYNRMRRECHGSVADSFNLVFAIKACVRLLLPEHGKLFHCLALKCGLERDPYVAPSLVEMYVGTGCLEDSGKVFDKIPERNSVLWGVMMKGCLKLSKGLEVFDLFRQMRGSSSALGFDAFTLECLVRACGNVVAAKEGKSVHGFCMKSGLVNNSVCLQTSVVDMYLKCGLLEYALSLFEQVENKDVVLWSALISGFVKNRRALEALSMFRRMSSESVAPNEHTLGSIIVSCSNLGCLKHGKSVHGYTLRNGIEMDVVNYTSFIDMYARCGCLEMARKVFDKMQVKNVITWSAMINAFGEHGLASEALACFDRMKSENQAPNSVTFVSIISACSHSGRVEEGLRYFESMSRDYGIEPAEEHYACMIDLLGRAGKISEAVSFINNMPMKPGASAWGALLSSCRIHNRVDLAKEVATKLLPLESDPSSVYVLLANIYADAGMWDLAKKVRRKMGIKGVQKTIGFTTTEVGE